MDEHTPKSRRVRKALQSRISASMLVIGIILILGIGYVAGTYNNQIMTAIAPTFGLKVNKDTLDLSSLQDTYQALKANYDGDINDTKLVEAANKGIVSALGDDYTVYFNAAEAQSFNDDLSGSIGGGIGAELSVRNERVTIVRVLADNPAQKAGLAVGDAITAINDVDVLATETLNDVVMKIRGDVGTTVKLGVLRDSGKEVFTITRAEVTNPSVYSSVQDGVGILTITRFDDQTGALARAAAESFKTKNVSSVILDLRGNGGGYLTAAQDVAGIWLNNKTVVTEKTNGKVVDELTSGSRAILEGIPTVVLVNGSSASASEITAGALQDHGAAKLVGEKTFGKGSVQRLLNLPGGAELKVTIAKWYTPNGNNISKEGIVPDEVVKLAIEDLNASRDPQLKAAKELLK